MVFIYILVMAVVTYLIRAVPLTIIRGKIENKFFKSFLYYVPYACLTSMTFPAILYATNSIITALIGFIVAVFAAFRGFSLMVVAIFACAAVFVAELLLML